MLWKIFPFLASSPAAWTLHHKQTEKTSPDNTHIWITGYGTGTGIASDKIIIKETRQSANNGPQERFQEGS